MNPNPIIPTATALILWSMISASPARSLANPSPKLLDQPVPRSTVVLSLPQDGKFLQPTDRWRDWHAITALDNGTLRITSTDSYGGAALNLNGLFHSSILRLILKVSGTDGKWSVKVGETPDGPDVIQIQPDTARTGVFTYLFTNDEVGFAQAPELRFYAVGKGRSFRIQSIRVETMPAALEADQLVIPRIAQMPNIPQPFKMRDWRKVARDYDSYVFDLNAKGEYLPLIWIDHAHRNFDEDAFGFPTTVGDPNAGPQRPDTAETHESINTMAAVIGASLVGIDKSAQNGHDWVAMCKNYFNRANGENIVGDRTNRAITEDFWYELFPNILFYELADLYPNEPDFNTIQRTVANQFQQAVTVLNTAPDGYDYNAFDFKKMQPMQNRPYKQPDSAAGFAWILYSAWVKFHDPQYLAAADMAMQKLNANTRNPYYEIILPFGAYTAARMDAELGRNYDTEKLLNWCFSGHSTARGDWGATVGRWGGYDASGLIGAFSRGYLMDTFHEAAPLVPLVRYDPRFARAIGKWMLNAANSARLFYPDELPAEDQAYRDGRAISRDLIGYEAVSPRNDESEIFADRDEWGPHSLEPKARYFSLYGSSHVGIFGGLIRPTSDEKILQIDCLKTDFYHDRAYPTFLYFNPYTTVREIRVDVGAAPVDLYDTVRKRFVARKVHGRTAIRLAADSAAVLVRVPTGGTITRQGQKLLVNGIVVDYHAPDPK